jgi:pimeloyl-ACP methyl ester carboxylesterase
VLAPGWPGMEGDAIVRELAEPPIIMGHSFGGLVIEILLDRGPGAAGVAIHPAPAKGILGLPFSTLKVGFAALRNPANNHRAVMLSAKQFRYTLGQYGWEEVSDYALAWARKRAVRRDEVAPVGARAGA